MKTDLELQRDVLDELKWEPEINAANIGVAVNHGIVTLTGHVPSYLEKWQAEGAAKRVGSVKGVANELDIKLPGVNRRTDEDLVSSALSALKANYRVPPDKIKVVVSNGWVTLDGDVEWQYQRSAAEESVRSLSGVLGVTNTIKVKPATTPTDVKQRIEEALRRHAEEDAKHINVEVTGGKVVLKGHVRAWSERAEAERAAWSAPGVHDVEDQISVGV